MLSHAFNQMTSNLKQLDNDRAVLLAGISHDLRTPLSRLRLGIEMLGEAGDYGLKHGMIQDIEDMDAIVNQFLDLPARRKRTVAKRRGSQSHRLQRVRAILAHGQIGEHQSGRAASAYAETDRYQMMVTNLVDNALRYGGGEVEVRTECVDGHALVRVLDRGPGIPGIGSLARDATFHPTGRPRVAEAAAPDLDWRSSSAPPA